MKLLFLDIDGVLNSSDWVRRRTVSPDPFASPSELAKFLIDPKAIARLNKVLERTGAMVVVSSAWRKGSSQAWMDTKEMLYSAGLKPWTIVGRTPNMDTKMGSLYVAPDRGDEIGKFLDEFRKPVEAFAAVDDIAMLSKRVEGHLVRTDISDGLLDEHVERLVGLLGEA